MSGPTAADDSLSADGYTREAAVRRLAAIHDGSELTHLLLRLNDWVPPVRFAAREAVLARLTPSYAEPFLRNLPLVARLDRARRADHSAVIEGVVRLLAASAREPLMRALDSPDRDHRRLAWRILASAGDPRPAALAAAASRDGALRLWALEAAPETLAARMTADPAGAIRARALMLLGDENALIAALLDRSGGVRDAARFALRGRTGDVAQHYRDALRGPRLLAAIAGLGETGSAADVALLLPLLAHPRARVRRAAVKASVRLGGADAVEQVIDRLADPARSVSAQVRDSVRRYAALIGGEPLWRMFLSSPLAHARANALILIAALPKWEAIGYLLRAAADDERAVAFIVRWNAFYNRNTAVPTAGQWRRAAEALPHARLRERLEAEVAFALRALQPA